MPAGDAQRVWFPEMLDDLRSFWFKKIAWETLADFCERMTENARRSAWREASSLHGQFPCRLGCDVPSAERRRGRRRAKTPWESPSDQPYSP